MNNANTKRDTATATTESHTAIVRCDTCRDFTMGKLVCKDWICEKCESKAAYTLERHPLARHNRLASKHHN